MLLSELTNLSLLAAVILGFYVWYEKLKCNIPPSAKPSIKCHIHGGFWDCWLSFYPGGKKQLSKTTGTDRKINKSINLKNESGGKD